MDQGMLEDAKSEYLILTKLEPDNFQHFFELGSIYFRANALDRATTFFKKSVALNPRHEQSHYYLGQIYYQNNLYPDAKQSLHRVDQDRAGQLPGPLFPRPGAPPDGGLRMGDQGIRDRAEERGPEGEMLPRQGVVPHAEGDDPQGDAWSSSAA